MSSKPIVYVTLGDAPGGIFKTQVVEVVQLLRKHSQRSVSLIAFVSIRSFFESKKKIKSWEAGAIVLPMFPIIKNWKLNVPLLFTALLLTGNLGSFAIGRGVFATNLLIQLRRFVNRIIYDGRGAVWAEAKEFNVYKNTLSNQAIFELERKAVCSSDRQLAVSNKLITYWKREFDFHSEDVQVIPCSYSKAPMIQNSNIRLELNWDSQDVLFVYSGSSSGWQGLGSLGTLLAELLMKSERNKLLFLSKDSKEIQKLKADFPNQVQRRWLDPSQVQSFLSACDYGLLIRPVNVTNEVASPVKFGEYLSCGLHVLISEGVGDYSQFVQEHNIGKVVQQNSSISELELKPNQDHDRIVELGDRFFSKSSPRIAKSYLNLIN